MEELRLEHLTFVGYQRPTGGQPGEAAAVSTSSPLVHFVAPQGSHVFFHPSPPTPTTSQQQQQSLAATRRPSPQKPGNDSAPPLPPPPPRPQPTASGSREGHKATQHEQQLPPPSVEADGLLNVLSAASAPPADFQVEFVLSSSSSSDSSTSSSRSASAAQDHPTAEEKKSDAAEPHEEDVKTDEVVGNVPALVEVAPEKNVKEEPVADDGAPAAAAVALPASYEHGIELVVQSEHQAQLDTLLTQCALKLFHGRLPQPPPPQPATAEGNSTEASSPVTWSEAPHYYRVVLMGYDMTAGAACLMAVPFAQPLAPPSSTSAATWRLCPLPVLLCPVAQLTHFFNEERVTEDKLDARPSTAAAAAAAGDESGARYPAVPRAVMSCSANAAKSARGSLATSPMPSPTNSPPRGGALLPPPPPPPPTSSSRPPPPPLTASAGTSSSTSPPHGTPSNAAGGNSAYSCPPLRWHFTSIGQLPSLDLAELFHVVPNTVYQLRSPAEEVVFMGVACGVPWVREVVRSVVAGGAGGGGGGGRGLTLQPSHATSASSGGAAAAAAAPAGYRWKDPRGLVVPLVCCHDARDLRGRHGLIDHAEKKAEGAPASAATAQTHENEAGKEKEEVAGHPQEQQQQSEKGEDEGHERQQSLPPPPPSLRTPAAATASTAAPRFVKEGDVVFVPGRFGVMLECVAKPAVLERLFGVVHGDRLLPRTSSEAGDSTAPAATAVVTVMGVYNRNGLVVLADGASHATQITIHRGAEEVAELFEKVQGKNDADIAATDGSKGGLSAPSSPPPAREEEEKEAVVVEESPESVAQRAGRTSIFVEESTTPLRDDVACSASGAALTTPDAAEGDPDKVSPFLRHSAEEEAGEGEEEEGGSMASAPPANAQAAPMFASTQRTPTPATSTQSSFAPSVGEAGATGVAPDPVAEDAAVPSCEDDCAQEMRSTEAGGAVTHTQVGADEVERNDEDGAVPHAPSTDNTAAPVVDSDDEPTPPPSTALLPSHAEEVTITSAGQSPTTAAPPTANDGDREGAVDVADAQLREGDVVVVAVAAEESGDEKESHQDDEDVYMAEKQDESEVMLNDKMPPALPTHHVEHSHTASPVLHTTDDTTASMSRVHGEDAQECSTSAAVLSSDHTPSILPTPSASLSRQLQSERRPDDNEGGAPHRHHEPQQHHMERANDDGIERHVINGDAAAAAAAPPVPHLPLPSHPLGAKHLLATQQHSDEMEKLNTAATVITPFEASAARSSESPSAVMPEAYYTDITTPIAAEPAGTVQHLQQGTHVGGPLYQEVFTPSYSPPAGPADGHTAPRVGGGGGSAGHARHPNGQAASPSLREAPRPLSMMTAASTAASAAPTPTPFTNFMKAFAIYSLRASTTEQLASTPALPGMPPILDFYRAQALKRVAAATAAHRRCRAAWSGVGVVAVQQLRQTATTTVFEDLCVDELVALLAVLCETSAT